MVKHMYRLLYAKLRFLTNPKFGEEFSSMCESQWFRREKILGIQQMKLRALINHAYENVPYYHRVFKDRGLHPSDFKSVDDLNRLPRLTKDDIRSNFKDMAATNFSRAQIITDATGGSTGTPLQFYTTQDDQNCARAAELRAYGWCGYRLGDKHAILWGSLFDLKRSEELYNKIIRFLDRHIMLNCFRMSQESMRMYALRLKKFKPRIVRGYASAVYLFAKFMLHEGVDNIKPKAVITSAETLFDHERTTIEEAFGCEVYDFYGSREASAIASECSEHSGHHISAENYVLECMKEGESAASGETGVILITNLRNYAMPFIRYEIGDLGRFSDEVCSCGRGLPLISSIEGRTTDIIVTQDGNFISTPVLTLIFKDLPVKQYQIIQEKIEEITVKIVRGSGYSEKDTKYIIRGMQKFIGKDVQIRLEFVDSIPLTNSGKRRPIISKIPIKFLEKNDAA